MKRFLISLFAILPLFFLSLYVTPVHAADFEGEWVGHWTNSLGESGPDTLSLYRSHEGRLTGNWSGNVNVWGRQTGRHELHLNGTRNNGTTYEVTAHGKHGELHLHYYATRPNGSTYEGWADLHRRY